MSRLEPAERFGFLICYDKTNRIIFSISSKHDGGRQCNIVILFCISIKY